MSSTAWENFINSSVQSKKDYYSDYAPPTGANASQKGLLGSPGSHFVDMSPLSQVPQEPAIIYERTGLLPDHWAPIGKVGDPRGTTLLPGSDQFVQFVSGNSLVGTDELRYDYDTKELIVSGNLRVSGKTHVTEVIDRTVEGAVSGHSGIFDELYSDGIHITDSIDSLSGQTVASITSLSHQFDGIEDLIDATGQLLESEIELVSGSLDATGQMLDSNINTVSGDLIATGEFLKDNINLVSGALDATGQLLEGEIKLVSGALDTTGQLLESEINIVSGNLDTTGEFLETKIDLVSGALDATGELLDGNIDSLSGQTLASITDLTQKMDGLLDEVEDIIDATGQFLEGEIDLVSGALDATGQLLEGEIDTLEGQTMASITDINQKISENAKNASDALDATGQLLEEEIDIHIHHHIDTVSGNLILTGSTLFKSIDQLSGETLATTTDLTQQIIDTAKNVSDAIYATGETLEESIDIVSDSLVVTGSVLEYDINQSSGEALANSIALNDDLQFTGDLLKKEINQSSGEALANSIALNDDLEVTGAYLLSLIGGDVSEELKILKNKIVELETNIDLVSGESMASFVNLSEQIPFFASIPLPVGQNTLEVKYASIGYVHTSNVIPKISASFRYDPTALGFYLFGIRDVTHNGFFVDFSDMMTEDHNFLEIVINKN